jgi:phage shock protein A
MEAATGRPQPKPNGKLAIDAATQRIEQMLNGTLTPTNEFVVYLVEQAKKSRQDLMVLQANIQQAEQQLAGMRQNMHRLQGQAAKYVEDIRAWDNKASAPSQKPVTLQATVPS